MEMLVKRYPELDQFIRRKHVFEGYGNAREATIDSDYRAIYKMCFVYKNGSPEFLPQPRRCTCGQHSPMSMPPPPPSLSHVWHLPGHVSSRPIVHERNTPFSISGSSHGARQADYYSHCQTANSFT